MYKSADDVQYIKKIVNLQVIVNVDILVIAGMPR